MEANFFNYMGSIFEKFQSTINLYVDKHPLQNNLYFRIIITHTL